MGNIGRSSTGCYLCRKRKIKCDEGKPGCRKCATIKKECPGYPFSVELKVRDDAETAPRSHSTVDSTSIAQLSHSSFDPSPSEALAKSLSAYVKHNKTLIEATYASTCSVSIDDVVPKCECAAPQPTLSLLPRHETILPPPKYDIQHQSFSFFLNLFCYQASRLYGAPILDYLPEMLVKSGPDSCIFKATKAVSCMTLADQYSGTDIRLQTGQDYGKALAVTNATIRNTSEAVKDETVVAVWLLGLYEAMSSVLSHGRMVRDKKTPEEEWRSHVSHIRGAMNLLRIRGASQSKNLQAEKIYRVFKAAIQMRLFMLNSVTSTDFENLGQDVYQDEHEFLPSETAICATTYFHRVARTLERIKLALREQEKLSVSQAYGEDFQDLIHEAECLDTGMSGWAKKEPGWDMMNVKEPTTGTMWAFYPSLATYYFYSFWVYLYWLRYLMARIKLYEGLITVARLRKKSLAGHAGGHEAINHLDFEISRYKTAFQLTAGEVVGLTAYALGDVTNSGSFHSSSSKNNSKRGFQEINVVAAMQLVIPLKVLQRSEHPTLTQKGAIDLALAQVGDGFRRTPMAA